ncbi:crossover junction endodeoxyribonuclease RuvC [Brevibacillus borstelensis]|uniref:crossover junction endodeoxyribonuclease RuvC n=1 Tax=Brevibacillus borstelensis TaxID=45462 RepID=UPI0030FC7FB5
MRRYVGIDPSTKLGLVIMDAAGRLLDVAEIAPKGEDPARMVQLVDKTIARLDSQDFITIEGFGFASQKAIHMGGIGWALRMEMYRKGMKYIEASPSQVKKFSGAGGNAAKEQVSVAVYKRWGFEHKSNNITDAYVLAQITRSFHMQDLELTNFQREVIEAIKNPPVKKSKEKAN